jgi:hypothetical protein
MTHRAHFWLRLVGLTLILVAEFAPRAPRLWAASAGSSRAVASVTAGR